MIDPDAKVGAYLDEETGRELMRADQGDGQPMQVAMLGRPLRALLKKMLPQIGKETETEKIFKRGEAAMRARKAKAEGLSPAEAEALEAEMAPPADAADPLTAAGEAPGPAEPPPGAPPPPATGLPDPSQLGGATPTTKYGPESGLNTEVLRKGFDASGVTDSDQYLSMIEKISDSRGYDTSPRTWASIDADMSDPAKASAMVRNALGDKTGRNWSDKEFAAAGHVFATIADDLFKLGQKAMGPDGSDADLVAYQQKAMALRALSLTLRGQRREAARALAINAKMSQVLNTATGIDVSAIDNVLAFQGGRDLIRAKVAMNMDLLAKSGGKMSLKQIDRISEKSIAAKTIDAVVEVWQSGLLYGLGTHSVNTVSNAITMVYQTLAVKPAAALAGSIRRGVGGDDTGVRWGEVNAETVGFFMAVKDAIVLAGRSAKTDQQLMGMDKAERGSLSAVSPEAWGVTNARGAKALSALQFYAQVPFRALGGADEFFKTIAYRQELYAQAHRAGVEKGLDGRALSDFVAKRAMDPTAEAHEAAVKRAEYQTYTKANTAKSAPGEGGNFIAQLTEVAQKFRSQYPILKLLMPFLNTPSNIVQFSVDNSIAAPLTARFRADLRAGGARSDLAWGRLMNGMALTGMTMAYFDDGAITGAGPKNYAQRKALELTGWRAYSIRIGDTYYQYNRYLSQFGITIAAVADIMDGVRYAKTDTERAELLMSVPFIMGEYMLELPMIKGLGGLATAIDRGKVAPGALGRFAGSFVPGFIKDVTKVSDPEIKAVRTKEFGASALQNIAKKIPVLSEDIPPARFWDGTIRLNNENPFTRVTGIIRNSDVEKDSGSRELVANGVSISEPSSALAVRAKNGAMVIEFDALTLDDQAGHVYDQYIKMVGRQRRKYVTEIINDPEYRANKDRGPNSRAAAMLQRAILKGKKDGMTLFFEWLRAEARKPSGKSMLSDEARATIGAIELKAQEAANAYEAGKTKQFLKLNPGIADAIGSGRGEIIPPAPPKF